MTRLEGIRKRIEDAAAVVNAVATRDYINSHDDDEIRDTYNEGVFDLFRAAYDYMDAGGSVKIRCVRELYYADIFDTVENIHGVVVEFIT